MADEAPQNQKGTILRLGDFAISGKEAIRGAMLLFALAAGYFALQNDIKGLDLRLQRIEVNQNTYVRDDVQKVQNESLSKTLGAMQNQLDRVERKLDSIPK